MKMIKIETIRTEIDQIDNQIIHLLNQRVELAKKIGEIKKRENLPIYVPERERLIYEKLEQIPSKVPGSVLKRIFKEIISYSRSIEYPIKISFLGPQGSYTHQAALCHFGSSIEEISCSSIQDVFMEVEKEKATYAVAPIENSYHGVVSQTLDCLIDSDLKIIGEIYLRIKHSLLSTESDIKRIKKIYSHPQSFEQSQIFLSNHLPNVERIEVSSNSQAAVLASREKNSGAIGSVLLSEIYRLNVLASGIEDAADNSTRFLVLGRDYAGLSKENKTSLIFSISDKPGALHDVIQAFSKRSINLTKIESRPSKRKAWDYIFFIDMMGHKDEDRIVSAIEEIKEKTLFYKTLGSYSKGEIY